MKALCNIFNNIILTCKEGKSVIVLKQCYQWKLNWKCIFDLSNLNFYWNLSNVNSIQNSKCIKTGFLRLYFLDAIFDFHFNRKTFIGHIYFSEI